jgi:F-type H+-transporting ATPase subunit gamma
MKMVAAAKLRRAQERMMAARPYAGALREVLASVAARVEGVDHPLLREREENRILLLVVTADKGLCGAFNTNINKAASNAIRDQQWGDVQILPIGRKSNDFFKRRQWPIRHQAVNIFQALHLDHAREIADIMIDDYVNERIDAIYVVYNEFKSVIQQQIRVERLLPFEKMPVAEAGAIDYLYEPGPEQILTDLIPKHVEFQLYRVFLESSAAEHGARMTAMDSATRNAADMIESLTLSYNRIRQAAITKEIIEIVSGASAAQG